MPLVKGAKPGSKGFGKNIATERKAGKPLKQSVAIAYAEAKEKRGKKKSAHEKRESKATERKEHMKGKKK